MVTVHSGFARTTAFEIRVDHKLLHKFVEFAPKYVYKVGTRVETVPPKMEPSSQKRNFLVIKFCSERNLVPKKWNLCTTLVNTSSLIFKIVNFFYREERSQEQWFSDEITQC